MTPLLPEHWPDESMYFGLAIQVTDRAAKQLHTAVLYQFDGRLMIGDLQSHLISRRDEVRVPNSLFWIAPDLSQEDQRILAAQVDAWLDENPGRIPYSVAHPGGVIFKDNVWVGNEPGQGLTCATFVVALFNELGIPFIDVSTWKSRTGDSDWAERILGLLAPYMTQQHFEAQKKRIGDTVRVRPADIAAAGLLVNQKMEVSLHFDHVAPLSAVVEANLLA